MDKINILFLAANPRGNPLQLDNEAREITAKIRASEHRDSLHLITRWAVRPGDLQQALLETQPHVLHFSGHGSRDEAIILVDDQGSPKPVSKEALHHLLSVLTDNIQVVVLNACYSRSQAEAITQCINCAVGMNGAIGDDAAILFAASFYRALGFGRSVKEAFELGRNALLLEGIPEDKTPELLVRRGIEASQLNLIPVERSRTMDESPSGRTTTDGRTEDDHDQPQMRRHQESRPISPVDAPTWVKIVGVAFLGLTLIFFMLAFFGGLTVKPENCFLAVAVFSLGAAIGSGFLLGTAAVKWQIPIPGVRAKPVVVGATGGIAVLFIAMILGSLIACREAKPQTVDVSADPAQLGSTTIVYDHNDPSSSDGDAIEHIEPIRSKDGSVARQFRVTFKPGKETGWFETDHLNLRKMTRYRVRYYVTRSGLASHEVLPPKIR